MRRRKEVMCRPDYGVLGQNQVSGQGEKEREKNEVTYKYYSQGVNFNRSELSGASLIRMLKKSGNPQVFGHKSIGTDFSNAK